MKAGTNKLRCAVYTRKSTEHGLELEFNSLHAQREACEAFIKSQTHEGWQGLAKHYDDPAFSGGNMNRPALKSLLKDIDAGLIDVVVVYKIDRLTRSLADFAKLVEAFDAKKISFVAVTQQFNTTTSMGRLTLNVLLSFAQFERELSSERVRDKVAASRKKGKWMGGSVPLGYDRKEKKLVINPAEAKTVRKIFERYLALKSLQKLADELRSGSVVTKKRAVSGKVVGSIPFTHGPLAYLLKNRTYLGESGHKGAWFPGEHEPIVDNGTFEKVQALLKSNSVDRIARGQKERALLTGILFDDRGNRMSPSYTVRRGVRYPFYVNSALLNGRKSQVGSVRRIPGTDLENAVLAAVKARTSITDETASRDIVERLIARIVLHKARVVITLTAADGMMPPPIDLPWHSGAQRDHIQNEERTACKRPPDLTLVQAVVRAHTWLKLLRNGTYISIESLAASVDMHPKVVRKRICLAFLAPSVTAAFLRGEQPAGITLRSIDQVASPSWADQHNELVPA